MKEDREESGAGSVLRGRYVRGDEARAAAVSRERANAEIAEQIYTLRVAAGMSQAQLAARIGTQQSVISRLEDADYEGHSVAMLRRIAAALGRRLEVRMVEAGPAA
jgi:ribosome-binding protein aMBF1 (putative translation factor)